MTTDTLGGVWNYSITLIKALKDYPIEIHLIGLGGLPSKNQLLEISFCDRVKFYPSNLKLEWMEHPNTRGIETLLVYLCDKIDPDLIHFNNYVNPEPFWGRPTITVFHSCVQTWWKAVKKEPAPQKWNGYYKLVESALCNADQLVFPSQAIQHVAQKEYRLNRETVVIPNACDPSENTEIAPIEKEGFIFCTGRIWDEAKNLQFLCTIARDLPWPIYVAGENRHPERAEESPLPNVRFLGKLSSEEINYWFDKAGIYINPALYEPFGLAVLEAAQAGCALALSHIDSLAEIWKDAALYFDPGNPEDMKAILRYLIVNPDQRNFYQKKAKRHASRYNSKTFGKRYFELYRSTINKKAEVLNKDIGKALIKTKNQTA